MHKRAPTIFISAQSHYALFDPDDEELSAEDDQYGRIAYLTKCDELAINPVSQILRFLETEEMQVMHYGLGGKGTLALVAA